MEGTTTNGEGLIPFKKGAFDIGASIKMSIIQYESNGFHPNFNFMPIIDFLLLSALQWKIKTTMTEIDGNFIPKKFTNWQEFAEESRKLMSKTMGLKIIKGNYKDYFEFEKKVSDHTFQYM